MPRRPVEMPRRRGPRKRCSLASRATSSPSSRSGRAPWGSPPPGSSTRCATSRSTPDPRGASPTSEPGRRHASRSGPAACSSSRRTTRKERPDDDRFAGGEVRRGARSDVAHPRHRGGGRDRSRLRGVHGGLQRGLPGRRRRSRLTPQRALRHLAAAGRDCPGDRAQAGCRAVRGARGGEPVRPGGQPVGARRDPVRLPAGPGCRAGVRPVPLPPVRRPRDRAGQRRVGGAGIPPRLAALLPGARAGRPGDHGARDAHLSGGADARGDGRGRQGASARRSPPGVSRLSGTLRGAVRTRGLGYTHAGAAAPALAGVDLGLRRGECLLVLGPSGSGKTTLALALAGLLDARAGGHASGGGEVGGPGGVVFQGRGDQVVMERVEDDVAFALERLGLAREEMLRAVPLALATVGLAGFERRRSATLSGGEQQRLALAGAIAPGAPVLVLDEPTANLDPDGARAFLERLAALRAAGTTVILVEHRVELAWALADRILVLGPDGQPVAQGTPRDVVASAGGTLVAAGIWLPPEIDSLLGVVAVVPPDGGPAGRPVVTADRVSYAYADAQPAGDHVDLEVGSGERVTLVGPNGGGKSTLGRLLVGLLRPSAGQVRLGGDRPDR